MTDKLIRMATQIADFFRSQPDLVPEQAVAGHINDFWTYRMRMDLLDQLRAGAAADPIVQASAPFIRLPHEATEGVKPTDPLSHQE
ncbi:MAG TPA: formate dehydrogenase subunit delta [Paracoccus sp. (in: a-proteobacteria)]|nr:formate dehydrogenase subunit delta [Paracoccus sp. (in: a-proteobacteria)]